LESKEFLKIGKPTPLGNGESFTKVYVPPVRRDFNNFGISPYFDCQFKVCIYVYVGQKDNFIVSKIVLVQHFNFTL